MWWLPCKETQTLSVNAFTSVHQRAILCRNTIKNVTDEQWCSALYTDVLPEKHRSLKRRREMKPPTTSVWSDKTWQSTFCLDVSGEKESACGEREVLRKTFEGLPAWRAAFLVSQNVIFLFLSLFLYCSRNFLWSENRPLSWLEASLPLFVPLWWQQISGTHWFQGCSRARTHANKANTHTHTAGGRCTHLATRAVSEVCW